MLATSLVILAVVILAQRNYFNTFGRSPVGDATYGI